MMAPRMSCDAHRRVPASSQTHNANMFRSNALMRTRSARQDTRQEEPAAAGRICAITE